MSAIVAALLGLLPEAFALFKGKDKGKAAEDFALAAIDKAKQLTGVTNDADAITKLKENPQLFLQWQTEMNAQAQAMVRFTEESAQRVHETYRLTGGALVSQITKFTLWVNPVLAFLLLISYIGASILMTYLGVESTLANVINTVAGPLVGAFFQQLMQERDRVMTFALGADYTKKDDQK
ncbi:MAG: hypothetical protein ACRCVV_18425 [Shewanella sp.]